MSNSPLSRTVSRSPYLKSTPSVVTTEKANLLTSWVLDVPVAWFPVSLSAAAVSTVPVLSASRAAAAIASSDTSWVLSSSSSLCGKIIGWKKNAAVSLAFEEMRTPYASGREICVQKFGNACQRNRETNGAFQKHLYHHQTIQRNTEMLFANDARFPFTMLACLPWSFASCVVWEEGGGDGVGLIDWLIE